MMYNAARKIIADITRPARKYFEYKIRLNFFLKSELRACSRTLGYFTPVHERGTQWDNIEEHIPTSLKQAPLIGFMSLAQLKAA